MDREMHIIEIKTDRKLGLALKLTEIKKIDFSLDYFKDGKGKLIYSLSIYVNDEEFEEFIDNYHTLTL